MFSLEEVVYESFNVDLKTTPLIILHGFFASSRNWRSLARRLADTRPVYVLDARNHGGSPHADLMTYPAMANDVVRWMEWNEIPIADFIGHSMGGKTLMWLGLNAPERIRKMIVVDISPLSYSHSFSQTIGALKKLSLESLGSRKDAEQSLQTEIEDLSYRQFLLQNLLLEGDQYRWRINLDIFEKNAVHIVGFPQLHQPLSYSEPVLFLSGENSSYIRPEAIYPLFPKANIVEIPNTGHWLHVDAPDAFVRSSLEWLSD